MADLLQVVITEDGTGYFLSQGDDETEESVEWGTPLEFNGVSYLADVDESGNEVTLSKVVELDANAFEVVSEGDEQDSDEEGVATGAD